MSNCNFRAPNGELSLLYSTLEVQFGPQKATQLWYETQSEQFKSRFEDIPTDVNGEPRADWLINAVEHQNMSVAALNWFTKDQKPFRINNGEVVSDVLNRFTTEFPEYNHIVKGLLQADKESLAVKIYKSPASRLRAYYDHTTDSIHFEGALDRNPRIVIHEVMHALTSKKLPHIQRSTTGGDYLTSLRRSMTDNKDVNRLINLYIDTVYELGMYDRFFGEKGIANDSTRLREFSKHGELHHVYGLFDLDEFIAEAFTSREFQKKLKGIITAKGDVTLWDRFVEAIRQLLGIGKNNRLAEVLDASNRIVTSQRGAASSQDITNESNESAPQVQITPEMFTKDGTSENNISIRIKALYDTASKNPDKIYQVPFKRNTPGIKQQGGPRLTMTRMAELFGQHPIPENVKFDPTFEGLMSVTPTRILNDIQVTPPTLIPIDAKILEQSKDNNFLKVRDEYGNPTGGWFSYEKQQEAIDSIVYIIYSRYMKGMSKVSEVKNAVEQILKAGLTRHLDIVAGKKFKGFENVTKAQAQKRVDDLQEILNVFHVKGDSNNLWNFALGRLKMYGLNIYGLESTEDPNQPNHNTENLIDQNDGEALRSYRDSSFELDRKDTASSRIKLFLSSIEDSDDRRMIRMAFTSALTREDILSGKKTTTIRTPEVAKDLGLKPGESAITKIDGRMVKVMSLGPITTEQLDVYADVAASEAIELKPGMVAYSLSPVTDESTLAIQKNYLGMPKLINFETTFQKLMAILADQEPSLSNFMSLLWQSPDPIIRRVAEKLDRESPEVKNEFVSVMSNQYQEFLVMLFNQSLNSDGVTTTQTRAFKANYSSQLNVLLRNWEQLQKQAPIAQRDDTGNTRINPEIATYLITKLIAVNDSGTWDTAGRILFQELMEANGLKMVPAFYDNFVKNALNITKGTRLQGTFERQFQFNKDGTPTGVISALIARMAGTLSQDQEVDNSFQVNNPMYTEGTAMNILARAALQFEPMVYSNSHRSSEGKSIYDHGLHTSTSHKVRRLKTDENYRNQKQQTYINEHNILLRALQDDPELRDRFALVYMDGIKPEYTKGTSGTSRSDMSFREQLLESLGLFEKRGSQKYADYVSLTHSDKTTTPIFENGPRIKLVTGLRITQGPDGTQATQAITNETYMALWNVFLDEYNRVTKTAGQSYNSDQFDKGKKYFFTMPEFNLDSMKKLLGKGEITKEEFNGLWTDLGAIKPIETKEAKQVVLKLFNRRIEILWKRTHQSWVNEGLVTKESVPFSIKYMNRLMAGVGIIAVETSPGNFVYNTRDGQLIQKEEAVRIASMLAARDYSVNHFIFNVSVSRLIFGDPAEVWKKTIPATMVEYQKRLAKDIAPGKDGEWSHSPQYTQLVIEDWEGPALEVAQLVSQYGEEVNATDGQEIITTQEFLDGKLAMGQIRKQVYDEMSKIIKDANGGYYEFTKPSHKLAMIPQKPVYVGEGELRNGVILTHYIKPSAYPLLPAYTVGKQLDALRTAMEKEGIARMAFRSAVKMGRPAVKLKLFKEDGSMDLSALTSSAFTGVDTDGNPVPSARLVLSRKGFRIQQELPHDPDKRKIGIVTQMNKLITQGISTITTPFEYQGNPVTAEALRNAKSEIRKEMFNLKRSEVEQELGVENGRMKNFNKLYDSLLDEASSRPSYTINDLELLLYRDKEGKPLMPMIFSPSRSRFESLLMNKIKTMTEMKMYGHSFVQATSAGIQNLRIEGLTDEEKKRIVFAGSYRRGQLKTLRHEDGTVKPAQVLVPFSFFGESKKLGIKSFITTDENGYQVIDSSKIPPEMLQMVTARIPNQGHSSMLPVEIVGFLPDEMADTIIVPAAITKQMGSDFDVDKLYTYQRPYIYSEGSLSASEDYQDKLLNAYFDIHWSILMHPEMTKRILSPLDKPDLKMEADKVPLPEGTDYFDVIEQLQSFQSQKFAKQLVGFTALSLTNNAVFESLNITLGQKVINEDNGDVTIQPYALEMVDPNGQVHQLSQFSGYGESINYDLEGAKRTKHDNIVTLLSGFLDHAKDPVTPQINLNLYTFNAAAALLRLQSKEGIAVGIPELAGLLRQPVLLEFSQMMSQANDSLSDSFESNLYGKVMEDLGMKYMRLAGKASSVLSQINLANLRDDWTAKDSKPFYERQLAVLNLFDILWKMGRQLADVQGAYNWDVGGPGNSIMAALNRENAISDTRAANPISNDVVIQGLEQMDDTEQGYIRGKLMNSINNIALEVFPYNKLQPVLDKFKETTGASFVSPKVQTALTEGFLAYQWTSAPMWEKDGPTIQDRVRLFYSGQHGPSLAKRVQDAKISWGRTNYLLQRLESNLVTSGGGPDFVSYSLGLSTGFDAAEVARSWNDILSSDDENRRRMAEDLVRYAILTGNTSTLARHIPISYILGTSLLQATEELQTGDAIPEIFITQFLQHYPQYNKQLSPDLRETGTVYEQYPETFKVQPIDLERPEEHPGRKLWITKNGRETYSDFLSLRDTETNKWVIYQQTSYLNYERIDVLGNSQIDEYSPAVAESIIPDNKAYQQPVDRKESSSQGVYDLPKIGGWAQISSVLSTIETTPTVPTLYRQLAGMLNHIQDGVERSVLTTTLGDIRPFSYEFTSSLEGMDALMSSDLNLLQISNTLKPSDFNKVLIHELIHYHTAATTTLFSITDNEKFYKNLLKENYNKWLKVSRELTATNPEVYQNVKALDTIRQQAYEQFKREPNLSEAMVIKLEYALSSTTEFLSHIFTDKDVMRWLNNRQANVEKTIWDKIVDAISAIMNSIAEFIGVGINQGSLLQEGVKAALNVMHMDNTIATITPRGIADINPDVFKNSTLASMPISSAEARKLETIIARLEDQKREIRQTFTGTITTEQAVRKRKLLDDLDKEILKLKDEQDLSLISDVGKTQLKWVDNIMSRKNPDANDIMVADRVLELWTNLITVMYGDTSNLARVDKEWADIAAKAQVQRQQLTSMSIDRAIFESEGDLSKRDFSPKELEDPSWIQVRLRGLSSAAKSRALQQQATYIETTGRMINEDVLRLLKKTQKLEDDFIAYAGSEKALPEVYNKLMQENKTGTAWGLVRRYSSTWYRFLTDAKAAREHRIDVINRDKSMSRSQKGQFKRIAWEDYWKAIHSQAAFVDTRLFFDETGENHQNYDKAFQELVTDVGQEQAEGAIKKARERYKKYLGLKEVFTDSMEADVLNGTKTKEEADKEIQEWVGRYSPNVFFNNFKNNFAVFNENNTDQYVVMIPRSKHTKYFDKKFTILQQDEKLYGLYNQLHETLMKLRSYLPKYLQYQLGENFLPTVSKSLLSDISSVPEYLKGMPDRFIRSLTASKFEETNKGTERIPISYVDTSKQKDPTEIASRSRDLIKITELFGAMAIHYKHFANAKDVIDMGQSIIREIDRTRMKDGKVVDDNGKVTQAPEGLKNALDALQYMKEYVMFKRARALEGNTNMKVYSSDLKTQVKTANRVKELIIQKEKLQQQLLDGEIDGTEWQEKLEPIDAELQKYDGRPIYGSKVGDKLISIAQAKALSFNPFSAVANFTFGVVSAAIFANGRQEFGNKQFGQALRIMMSSTGKWLSFGSYNTEQSRKIMNVLDTLGVMGDVVESQYGKLEHRERVPKWKKNINPYTWLRSGDYFCRGLNTVATLLNEKVKVTENGEQKEISLWEALDNNGYWNEAKYGKRPEYYSENVEDQKEWNKVRNKIARVNMIIMGNVDKVSPKMANKWIIGRLLGQFRLSWLPEGWYSRFAEEKYDVQLGRMTKGRFTTLKDLGIGGSLKVLLKQYASLVSKTDPFTGEHKLNGKPISPADIENMRRNFAEINFYLMVLASIFMMKSMVPDDDDDDSQALQIMINMLIRTKQDLSFYSSPDVFDTVTRNAVPSFGVIKDYTKLMDASWKYMTDDDYTADRWALKLTHAGLPIPQATLVNKIKYMSERDLDDLSR